MALVSCIKRDGAMNENGDETRENQIFHQSVCGSLDIDIQLQQEVDEISYMGLTVCLNRVSDRRGTRKHVRKRRVD